MFVCTRCAVGTSARPQLDASIVEVLLKFAPLVAGGSSVFAVGSSGPAMFEELLVVGDHVFGEDGVAAGGLNVQVAEQRRADVDRKAVVDQFGGQQPPEVVWSEPDVGEFGMCRMSALTACATISRLGVCS